MPFDTTTPGRILGIGGIFFKSPDAAVARKWYGEKLGLPSGPEGTVFHWRSHEPPDTEHMTVWSVFPSKSTYFDPSKSGFMINYIVDDMEAFLAKCKEGGVHIDPKRQSESYGHFAWIYDPDGNKIELWQPLSA